MDINLWIIVGIAAGGVFLLCAIAILLIRWRLHWKHKRKMSEINAAAERDDNRFPPNNMTITDDDVGRMPGTRVAPRHSFQDRNRRALYTPMLSRETLDSKPVLKSLERVKQSTQTDRETIVPMWPLPRRCIRSDGSPLSKKTSQSPRNRKESALKTSRIVARNITSRPSQEQNKRPSSSQITQNQRDVNHLHDAEEEPTNRDNDSTSPNKELKPQQLFQNKRRSQSHGNASRMVYGIQGAVNCNGAEDADRETPAPPRGTQSAPRRTHVPRSMSVCSQDPGAAPTHLLPPLPFEIPCEPNKRVKSPTDFSGCGSLFSDNTSILDDEESKILSHAETDLTSICFSSPFFSSPISQSTPKDFNPWNKPSRHEEESPRSVSKPLELRPKPQTQDSFRASIEESLPGSRNSDLSLSLLDPAFRPASSADIAKRKSRANSDITVGTPRRGSSKKAKRTTSPISSARRPPEFNIHEDSPTDHAPTSVLRSISGNEISNPFTNTKNPFLWDPTTSIQSTNPTNGPSNHHRQNGVHNANILSFTSSPKPSRMEELKENAPETTIKHTVIRRANMTFRPPSRATFDVHYTPLTHHLPTLSSSTSSPTTSSPQPSPASAIYTPTRKPSAAAHPNRTKSIFSTTTHPWPLPDTTPITTTNPLPSPSPSPSHSTPSRHTSTFYNFPFPSPHRPFPPNWRAPKTPIRGPRAFPARRSPSRSPSRSPIGKASARNSGGASRNSAGSIVIGKDALGGGLRASIMQLRRQNSEAGWRAGRGSREHKRYLSVGDDDVFEGVGRSGKENFGVGGGGGGF